MNIERFLISRGSHIAKAIVGLFLACASWADAHQPFESSALVLIDGNRLEISVTASSEIAGQLAEVPQMNGENVEKLRPRFLKIASELYNVSIAGRPVSAERTFFRLLPGESTFSAVYWSVWAGDWSRFVIPALRFMRATLPYTVDQFSLQ